MSFYFARHGETDWNIARKIQGTTETEINGRGLEQAGELLQTLKQEAPRIKAVYTSYQKRAYTTAEIVAKGYDVPVKTVDGLQEMNLGIFEGHAWDEVMAQYPKEFAYWVENKRFHRPTNGENYQEVIDRLADALSMILKEYDESFGGKGDVLIVSHGAVLMAFMTVLKELDFYDSNKHMDIRNATPIRVERGYSSVLQECPQLFSLDCCRGKKESSCI